MAFANSDYDHSEIFWAILKMSPDDLVVNSKVDFSFWFKERDGNKVQYSLR